ncbi:inner-membrane translocator [Thermoproteus uzoniensis 768-20]|uniref:Inner-membrane translocator n=1 Tax=Thermoproteus uzoniensis (strain 768-20) TaxID=999630 RepID=F2L0J9_THEU7|nr:branched-chain amino acid ABC transporter permease [Thermoproteus uzoniensis]AEA12681.1 inner-membrane translocator [Thermoproteus uzoniensis 768-20]
MSDLYKIIIIYTFAVIIGFLLSNSFIKYELSYVLIWSAAAWATAVLLEYGLVNFGIAMYYALGAYAVALLYKYWGVTDFALGISASALAGAAWGLVVGYALGSLRGIYYSLANLSLSMVIYGVLVKFYDVTGGSNGLYVPRPQELSYTFNGDALYWVAATVAGALLAAMYRFQSSDMGRVAEGIRLNELRVRSLGASPRLHITAATAAAGAVAAVGGALMAYLTNIVTPDYSYWTASGEMVVAALIGLLASRRYGFLIGSAFYQIVRLWSYQFTSPELVIGLALLSALAVWRRRYSRLAA